MIPKSSEGLCCGHVHGLNHEQSLEHLRHIPKVECVVRPGGRWQQLISALVVDLYGASHCCVGQALHISLELGQESVDDGAKDCGHGLLAGRRHAEHQGMPRKAKGHLVATSAWRSGTEQKSGVLHVLPLMLFAVEKASLICHLAQKLDWWLRSVFFHQGHVDVINEDHHGLVHWSPKQCLSFALKLALDGQLSLQSLGLGAESHVDRHNCGLLLHALKQIHHIDALADARVTCEEERKLHGHHAIHDIREANRVWIWNKQLEE
mmetsp:Transcript_41623/g.67220  ORF Transcript_41623/g.67220 Transcript_41623/m.67220 type:complete len:264 (+) Transcript_41623:836-1627(+)